MKSIPIVDTKIFKNLHTLLLLVLFTSFINLGCSKPAPPPKATLPVLTTTSVTTITPQSGKSGGNITSDGGASITARGVCWSLTADPTITNSKTSDGTGSGTFTSSLTGLDANTTYHVRAYATNSAGTAYGSDITFTTTVAPAAISTIAMSEIKSTSATSGGDISSDGGSAITARGVCWKTTAGPTTADSKTNDGTGTGAFSSAMTSLTSNTTYYVRAYATNSNGTIYGNELSFKTALGTPSVATNAVEVVTETSAQVVCYAYEEGASPITAYGVCWKTTPGPTVADSKTNDGAGIANYTSQISGLTANTTYYVRAYATNSIGTSYGDEKSFKTLPTAGQTVTDIDGNVYTTINIGTQVWLKENLVTTHYRNGDAIPSGLTDAAWSTTTSGASAAYGNNNGNVTTYGRLYNWFAAVDPRNIAPVGWHVPTKDEWMTLFAYLGGYEAGGKMKEAGFAHWDSPNADATNSSNFTALPGGYRATNGSYNYLRQFGYWWSTTPNVGVSTVMVCGLFNHSGDAADLEGEKPFGLSIRCIKD